MNIAFGIRPDYLTNRGGDTYQMLKTKEYLERFEDMNIQIITRSEELKDGFDILHIFNMQNPDFAYEMLKKAKNLGGG